MFPIRSERKQGLGDNESCGACELAQRKKHSFCKAQIRLKSVEKNTKVAGQFADKCKTDKRLAGLKT